MLAVCSGDQPAENPWLSLGLQLGFVSPPLLLVTQTPGMPFAFPSAHLFGLDLSLPFLLCSWLHFPSQPGLLQPACKSIFPVAALSPLSYHYNSVAFLSTHFWNLLNSAAVVALSCTPSRNTQTHLYKEIHLLCAMGWYQQLSFENRNLHLSCRVPKPGVLPSKQLLWQLLYFVNLLLVNKFSFKHRGSGQNLAAQNCKPLLIRKLSSLLEMRQSQPCLEDSSPAGLQLTCEKGMLPGPCTCTAPKWIISCLTPMDFHCVSPEYVYDIPADERQSGDWKHVWTCSQSKGSWLKNPLALFCLVKIVWNSNRL